MCYFIICLCHKMHTLNQIFNVFPRATRLVSYRTPHLISHTAFKSCMSICYKLGQNKCPDNVHWACELHPNWCATTPANVPSYQRTHCTRNYEIKTHSKNLRLILRNGQTYYNCRVQDLIEHQKTSIKTLKHSNHRFAP